MSRSGYWRKKASRTSEPVTDYPPDVIAQSEGLAARQAERNLAAKALCATCGKSRGDSDHQYVASSNRPVCRFVEPSNAEGIS